MHRFLISMFLSMFAVLGVAEQADRSAELRELMREIVVDPSRADGLILPDAKAWFTTAFGTVRGELLTEEYLAKVKQPNMAANIARMLAKQIQRGRTEINVLLVDAKTGTGLQRRAMKIARVPLSLYSVRFVRPGEDSGFHLWSVIHDGEAFRIVGKMWGVSKQIDRDRQSVLDGHSAELVQVIKGILVDASQADALILPDPQAWFTTTFGAERAKALTDEYVQLMAKAGGGPGIARLLNKQVAGKSEINAYAVDVRLETGLQRQARLAAGGKLRLYSVRLKRPGAKYGFRLWSFVHDGKAFRFVGKMRAIQSP